jgi:hypothetical protein
MPTIFSLADFQSDIDVALIESCGDVTPAIQAMLDVHEKLESDKIDAYGIVYRDHMDRAASCRKLAEELEARAKQHEATADGRRRLMQWYMERRGMRELSGSFARFSIAKNGGNQKIELKVPEADVPDSFRKPLPAQPTRGDVDTNAIRAAIAAGSEEAAAIAILLPRTERVDISFGPRKRNAEKPEVAVNLSVLDGQVGPTVEPVAEPSVAEPIAA